MLAMSAAGAALPAHAASATKAALPSLAGGSPPIAAAPVAPVVASRAGSGVTALPIPAAAGAHAGASSVAPSDRLAGRLVGYVKRPVVSPFSLVAVTWDSMGSAASGSVIAQLRTREDGTWSSWTELVPDTDGPSAAEDGSVRAGTAPYWVKRATGVEVAVYTVGGQSPTGLEVATIDPGRSEPGWRAPADARALASSRLGTRAGTFPRIPRIVTRAEWGADESLGDGCWDPRYGTRFDAAIVHHTAGSNDYSRREAASLVRGVLAYHTVSRGWCDIGYNFLIDRYGTVYEGRAGGIRRAVRGAHSGDYNVNTTGISVMGNFDLVRPTRALKHSLVQLIAWRLGSAYHGAYGKPFIFDGRFSRISGHRDVMQTACPGRHVYSWIPTLRERVTLRLGDYRSKIERAWREDGARRGDLGAVRIGERGEDGGRHTTFAGGRMYSSSGGVHTLERGAILTRYVSTGETSGKLGYPVSKQRAVDGDLRVRFEHGTITLDRSTGKTSVTLR
jgi:hypothetical protein